MKQPISTDGIIDNFLSEAIFNKDDPIIITKKELRDYVVEITQDFRATNKNLRSLLQKAWNKNSGLPSSQACPVKVGKQGGAV